jgi:UDP-N-acetylmuramyl tripeptide synthase
VIRIPDLRLAAALAAAKGTYRATQLLGRSGGTAAPGLVGERVDPRLIAKVAARLPEGAVVIAGTNGKTTTSRMLTEILTAAGKRVLNNGAGSNLSRGIAATFARQSSLLGAPEADIAVIESDEAALPAVVAAVRPRLIVLNNLFRDQLDRYGELNSVATKWEAALRAMPPGITLVYDADDPTLCTLACRARPGTMLVPFGLGTHAYTLPELTHAADAVICPKCGAALEYHTLSVGHLGDWYCPTGDNARPPLAFVAEEISLHGMEGASFTIRRGPGDAMRIDARLPGLYNVYNIVGACAAARTLGIQPATIAETLCTFVAPFGRIERVELLGRRLTLALIKNPTGANEVLRLLMSAPPAPLLICINDLVADGRDVSWLWDTDFETLAEYPAPVIVSGIRALDMAVRLKYAGLPPEKISMVPEIGDALVAVAERAEPGADAYVLPTYTAMLAAREALHDKGALRDVWATAERR